MIDHIALLPAYLAAGTAVLALLSDLLAPGRRALLLVVSTLGALATGVAAVAVYRGGARTTLCAGNQEGVAPPGTRPLALCSYEWDRTATLVAVLFVAATVVVLALSVPVLRAGAVPPGEYAFLLACSMTGGVVLGAARDLITLIIAVETLTLPLYVLVGLRRRSAESAQAAITFYVVSVVSTSVTLLGAALLYAATGAVHFDALAGALADRTDLLSLPMVGVAVVALLVGLAFKVAAVPFHAWAPATYDGAPLPVAAYLSTASKLGGVIALVLVVIEPLRPWLDVAGPAFAVVAALTMTIGNLVALRQRRMVRLLAWSSVAQAGYILAPFGALALASGRTPDAVGVAATAVLAYTVFYVALELGAFGAVVALRGAADGGTLADYRGAAAMRPWVASVFVLAMAGLAGLPPALAGLFAKVAVVRALLEGGAGWLAVVVALNAVVGLAYYVRASVALTGREPSAAGARAWPAVPVAVGVVLTVVTLVAVIIGFAPQLVLDVATIAAR